MRTSSSDVAASASPAPFDRLLLIERRVRSARPDVMRRSSQLWLGLAFRVRDQWFVAPREDVREILPLPPMSRVPGGKPWLLGVANVRGSILPVSDLAQFLGQVRRNVTSTTRVLVLNNARVPAGLLVDEVAGYRQFAPEDQRHARTSEAGTARPFLLGAFERDARLWWVMSLHKLGLSAEFSHAGY